jgi:hypothetical protein
MYTSSRHVISCCVLSCFIDLLYLCFSPYVELCISCSMLLRWAVHTVLHVATLSCVGLSVLSRHIERRIPTSLCVVTSDWAPFTSLCVVIACWVVWWHVERVYLTLYCRVTSSCCCQFLILTSQQVARINSLKSAASWRRRKLVRDSLLKPNAAPLLQTYVQQERIGCLCGDRM